MLLTLGYVLAGVMLYDYFTGEHKCKLGYMNEEIKSDTNVIYRVKSGDGELSLPPCELMSVELGPSIDTNKATLQVMVDKSMETEYKPVTDIGKEKKYVKLIPTQYNTNIILKTKKKSKVPITAYYKT